MKNREYRALLAVALMVSLVAGSVKGTMSYVRAEDNQTAVTAQADVDTANETEKDADSQAQAKKDETVYVKLDGSGNAKSVTVSDQLKNVGDISEIKDVSELKDIENVKGDEEFTRADGKLVWGGENKDICYQGTTDKALPVGVKISYQLDGKDISAEELEGKSGHLKIHYEYQNTTGDEKTAYTPFLMVTGLVLDSEKFTNVMVENGKLVSDGEKDIAIGMGIPKLKETLDVKDIDIPDSFVVEADVTEYTAVKGITVATNEVFNELSTDEFDDIDDLKNAMNELQDAANQLVDGSGKLRDGLDTLLESSGTLIDGIGALAAGGNDLAAGTGKLLGGAEELAKGSTTLADGTGELAEGAKNLNSGAEQIAAGAQSAKGGSAALVNGAEQLNGGIKTMQSEAESAVQQLSAGAQNLKNGIAAMKNGADSLNAGIDSAATGAAALQAGVQNAKSGVDNISALAQGIELQTTAADSNYEVSVYVNNAQKRNAVAEVLRSAGVDEATIENAVAQISDETVTTTTEVVIPINAGTNQTAASLEQIKQLASGVSAGLGNLDAGAKSLAATLSLTEGNTIKAGAAQLSAALDQTGALSQGAEQLNGGIIRMGEKLQEGTVQLQGGAGALLAGGKELEAGLGSLSEGAAQLGGGSKTLSEGAADVDAGAKALSAGAGTLSSKAVELDAGAQTLSTGLGTLQEGTGALLGGVQQLDDGAAELNDGMIQFNEDGIQKLVSVFDGDIGGLLDKVNDMLDASRAYKNFSGISEEMDGEVKFIFVSDK